MTLYRHPAPRGRRSRALVLLLVAVLLLAACGGGDGDDGAEAAVPGTAAPPVEEGEPVRGGSLTVALEAETNSWLPGSGLFAQSGTNVAYAIYDSFMKRTAEGDVRPYLAQSLTPNSDLSEWTLRLRPGVKFHDGTDLDAAAVKAVFDGWLTAEGSNLAGVLSDVERVQVVDDLTVRYVLRRGNAAFPDVLTGAAGWPFSPTAAEAAGDDAGARPAGTGPFIFDSWQRDSRLVLRSNPFYWQEGLPYLDELVFRPIPDEDTRLAALLAGDVDAMQSLRQATARQARQAQEERGIELHEYVGNNGGGVIFNTERPPVDDARVRRALAFAVNQADLVEVLGGAGLTEPMTQWFSEDSPWYSESAAAAWPNDDPEQAEALLQRYVDDPARSDGQAPGSPVSLTFSCPPDATLIEVAQLYQAFWESVGVDVELEQVEQSTHIQRALAGDYTANCWRMGGEQDPYIVLSQAFGPPETQPLNFTNFHDDVVGAQLEVLRTRTDFGVRYVAVETLMLHFTREVPNLWTGGTLTVVAAQPEVDNIGGWVFPDGTEGDGTPNGQVMWGHVWRRG